MSNYHVYYSDETAFKKLLSKHAKSNKVYVITDKRIKAIYSKEIIELFSNYQVEIITAKDKSFKSYQKTILKLLKLKFTKNDLLVAFGGGTIGDLTGFVASTIYRGVNYIQVPTTLLAQIDSSVGAKTAIDTTYGKNLVGTFYEPLFSYINTRYLDTLTTREYNNGFAEALKMALLFDKKLYHEIKMQDYLTLNQIKTIINYKKDVVVKDPFDTSIRRFLNFGHTFGHAIEKTSNYRRFKHGEAISHGMLLALEVGQRNNLTNPDIYNDLRSVLTVKGLLNNKIKSYDYYLKDIIYDKKNDTNGLNFIVLKEIGEPEIIIYKGN